MLRFSELAAAVPAIRDERRYAVADHRDQHCATQEHRERHSTPISDVDAVRGKVDHGGGGTVALFLAAYGMQVIDLGPAILSMHSPFELASSADLFATKQAFRAFLEAQL